MSEINEIVMVGGINHKIVKYANEDAFYATNVRNGKTYKVDVCCDCQELYITSGPSVCPACHEERLDDAFDEIDTQNYLTVRDLNALRKI